MSCLNFDGISGKLPTMLLYALVGILQITVLLLQWFAVSNELAEKCPQDATTTQREISNWSGWLNGGSLILGTIWTILIRNRDHVYPLFIWFTKILWIGATAVAALFAAVSTGHMLTIGDICTDASFDAKTIRNTSVSILVIWILLLGLGHMGASMAKQSVEQYEVAMTKKKETVKVQDREEIQPFINNHKPNHPFLNF